MEHRCCYSDTDVPSVRYRRRAGGVRVVTVHREVELLTPGAVRELAARLGVRPSKRLGQNFVTDQGTVRRIAALAKLGPDDIVLEVGPGLGSLTLALLAAGAGRVIAVEVDRVLAGELPHTLAARAPELSERVLVVPADALGIGEADLRAAAAADGADDIAGPAGRAGVAPAADPASSPGPGLPSLLVANLPYNIAVPVVLHLLAALPSLARGLVMVQAEVADRMCAGPGSRVYGGPSVKLAWYAAARPAGTVPRTVFWPVPNVDSRLVAFTRHDPPPSAASRAEVFALIDAAFGQRRKTLRAALAGWAGSAPEAERLLRAAGIDPGARGEALSVAEFARLASARTIASS
jgi:16S rRNA (adenine1518-N6/adenine1519-N6)-dimethyltransferase